MKKIKYLNGLFLLVCVLLILVCVLLINTRVTYAATEYETIAANDFMDPSDCIGRTFVIQGNIARAWGEVRETNFKGEDYNLGNQYWYYDWSTCRAGLYGITESGEEEEIIARDITSSTASCSELAGSLSFGYKITEEDANKYTLIVFKYSGTTASVPSYNPGRGYWRAYPASYSASCKREVLKFPTFTNNLPSLLSYNYEDSPQLSVSVAGATPLTYQWYENGMPISGATSNTLNLEKQTTLLNNGKSFYCIATNILGSTTSQTCVLTANVGTFKPSISASSLTILNHKKLPISRAYREPN